MVFSIELEQEADGRWIAEVPALPGVLAYGATDREAKGRVKALALGVVADRLEHGEEGPDHLASISFRGGVSDRPRPEDLKALALPTRTHSL